MKQTVTELVGVILRMMDDHSTPPLSESSLRSWLANQGYSKRDIDAAIKAARPRFVAPSSSPTSHQPGSIRSYSLQEEYKLSQEARDALTRLELYGLVGPHEREQILENLGHFEGEVGLEELECLLSWLVCGGRDVEFQQTVARVLENRGDAAH
jgi:uncharacterized protein Smg (DUF494 family)